MFQAAGLVDTNQATHSGFKLDIRGIHWVVLRGAGIENMFDFGK